MFKIIPLFVSLMLAGSGAIALSAPKYFSTTADTNLQSYENGTLQDSSLFLSANGRSDFSTDINSEDTSGVDNENNLDVESNLNINI